jgi:hypothetical protein
MTVLSGSMSKSDRKAVGEGRLALAGKRRGLRTILPFLGPAPLISLVWFTSRRDVMGVLVNPRWLSAVAWTVTLLILALNLLLLYERAGGPLPF